VKDLLRLPFNIGATTVFTIGNSDGNVFDAAFPLRKAAHSSCKTAQSNLKTVVSLNQRQGCDL
jgi:hypothetical protein